MPKLMVRYGKSRRNEPFHPRLEINTKSGYCPNHWQEQHFRPGVFTGAGCVAQIDTEEAVKMYLSELKRMNYVVVTS